MTYITGSSDGPVAVTGASGFVGSHIVKNLVEHGYDVRACVRDASRQDKTFYLKDMDKCGPGNVQIFSCDLFEAKHGVYDEPFSGCSATIHAAAAMGTDTENYEPPSPLKMYESILDMTRGVLRSCTSTGTVKRVIYTSSAAAIYGPTGTERHDDFIYSEEHWSGGTYETLEERHTGEDGETVWTNENRAYAKGKVDAEKLGCAFGDKHGIDFITICPSNVLGPLLGKSHNNLWQYRLGFSLSGKNKIEMNAPLVAWNIVDVRDVAQAHRLALESEVSFNGSRYCLTAKDERAEISMHNLLDLLQEMFPKHNVCGGYRPNPAEMYHRCRCTKAIKELGIKPREVRDTLRDTGISLIELGCVPDVS